VSDHGDNSVSLYNLNLMAIASFIVYLQRQIVFNVSVTQTKNTSSNLNSRHQSQNCLNSLKTPELKHHF